MIQLGANFFLEFTELLGYSIPEGTIKAGLHRYRQGGALSWRNMTDPTDARRVLIDYDSIPAATLRKYEIPAKEILGRQLAQAQQEKLVQEAQVRQMSLPASVQVDTAELTWLLNQKIERVQAHGLARLAGWLKLLLTAKPSQCRAWGLDSKEALYAGALEAMTGEWAKKVLAGQKVNNVQVLKRKVKAYKLEGVAAVVSKRTGLRNAQKLTEMQENLLIQLYADPRKADFDTVHRLLEEASVTYGWPLVGLTTCKTFLMKPATRALWTAPRHGVKMWHDQFDPIIPRNAPSFANALWVLDGTPLELYFREGKKAHNRFEIFVVLDAHSWKIVGYALGRSENTAIVRQALRMACRLEGAVPHQVLNDNSSAIKSAEIQQLLPQLATYVTPAKVGNARTKIVEPFFKHLNARVLKWMSNYSGSNITAKSPDSHINPDAAKAEMKFFPQENEALEQVHLAIATWNEQIGWKKRKVSIREWHATSVTSTQDRQRPFNPAMDVAAFYYEPKDTYLYTNRGFDLVFRGERYVFDVEEVAFRRENIGARFAVRFDPERMDALYLYQMGRPVVGLDGQAVAARPKTKVPMALVDRQAGDGASLARLLNLKNEQWQATNDEFLTRVDALPVDLKMPITLERVHKTTMNAIRQNVKALELAGEKTIPMPSIRGSVDLYGDDEDNGPMKAIAS